MKISRKRFHNILKKGMAAAISVSMLLTGFMPGSGLSSSYAYADTVYFKVSNDVVEGYHQHMNSKGYKNTDFNTNRTGRAQEMIKYLNTKLAAKGFQTLYSLNTSEVPVSWNPDQAEIDNNDYQLYMLEWVNSMKNPGSGFSLYGRLVYLTSYGTVRYSEQVTLDEKARTYSGLTYGNQFDKNRPNQCTFGLPSDCQQILGIMLYKDPISFLESDDDNPWNFSSLTITRIKDDSLSNIGDKKKNSNGFDYRPIKAGDLHASVSTYDIKQAHLGVEADLEWLYLLQPAENLTEHTPDISQEIVTGSDGRVPFPQDMIAAYRAYMFNAGYSNLKFNDTRTGRTESLVKFLNTKSSQTGLPTLSMKTGEQSVTWNPTKVEKGQQLYLLEWVNGTENMGDGFNLYGRIVYLNKSNEVVYCAQATLDSQARSFSGLSLGNQFDRGRPNQCTFLLPSDCKQILGIMLYKDAGGGDDNDPWNMSKLTITRVADDSLDNLSELQTDRYGYNYVTCYDGYLAASVCDYDIDQAYLGTEASQEWLYLLQAPHKDYNSGDYTCLRITNGSVDLDGKSFSVTLDYYDIYGYRHEESFEFSKKDALKLYPELIWTADFSPEDDDVEDYIKDSNRVYYSPVTDMMDPLIAHSYVGTDVSKNANATLHNVVAPIYAWAFAGGETKLSSFYYYEDGDRDSVNRIALEILTNGSNRSSQDILRHMMDYGNFKDYTFQTADTTQTNLYGAVYFGNFISYDTMVKDFMGPYSTTDVVIHPAHPIGSVETMTITQTKGSGYVNIQDVSLFTANAKDFNSTRMNGGMSSERLFDIKDGLVIAEVEPRDGGIQLSGNTPAVCKRSGELSALDRNQHRLVSYPGGKSFSNFSADDNLGIELDIADIYEAGLEIFAAGNAGDFLRFSDGLQKSTFLEDYKDLYNPDRNGFSTLGDFFMGTGSSKKLWDWLQEDPLNSTSDIKNYLLQQLAEGYKAYNNGDIISTSQALSLLNLIDAYYKDPIVLDITYIDEYNNIRKVEVPLTTVYGLQAYSDATIGTNGDIHLMGIFQQGQQAGVRVPLSQYDELVEINLKFGGQSSTISSFRSNKFFYEPTEAERNQWRKHPDINADLPVYELLSASNALPNLKPYEDLGLKDNETIRGGALIPTYDTLTLDSIQIYEHVTESTFKNANTNKHYLMLTAPKKADYHYESDNYQGFSLVAGSSLLLTASAELSGNKANLSKGSADSDTERGFYEDLYLIEILGKTLTQANYAQDLTIQLKYTTTAGEQITSKANYLSTLSQEYYGTLGNYTVADSEGNRTSPDETYYTGEGMKHGQTYYTVRLSGVKNFDSITIEIPDGYYSGWQIDEVNVKKVTELGQRYSDPASEWGIEDFELHPNIQREHEGDLLAFNNRPTALQSAGSKKTFNFTVVNPDGSYTEPESATKEDTSDYISGNPTSIPYEDTLKNLGLSLVKYQYDVRVDVANIADAGSSNYFYFQLVFENGTSGVVLANQQLASDSFRQGESESFIIKTTQNYGELKGIRIICDASSANSQTFDKLNIDSVTVSLANKGGIRSWIIDNVGWVDINYRDQGVSNSITATLEDQGFTNEQVVKEFPVSRKATAARILFNITTSASTLSDTIAQNGKFEGVLTYVDSAGYTKTYNFDLLDRIEEFNGSTDRTSMLRPNMSNYFSLLLTDISSIKALTIYRSNGTDNWVVSNVVISQISELGDAYLSMDREYKRYIEDEVHLTESTNINETVPPAGSGSFTFPQHSIVVNANSADPDGWTTTITRIPTSNKESFNVYLIPGGSYSFSKSTVPNIQGVLDYTFKTGNNLGQEAFTFNDTGEINGTIVLKAAGIKITDMNALKKLHLKYTGSSSKTPVIAGAKVERVRDNTIIETYYFDFLSHELASGTTNTALAKADTTATNTTQTLVLQPSEGQNFVLTPSSSDVAVALLYRSENDAKAQTSYFASPYKFLTDAEITLINSAMPLEIPFEIDGISEVVGIAVIGSGPNVKFDNAMVYNYIGNSSSESLLNVCEIAEGFTVDTSKKIFLAEKDSNVTPVTFTLYTSSDDNFAGAGTSGTIPVTINYTDTEELPAQFKIRSLSDYLPPNTVPAADSKVSFTVMLNNFDELESMDISVENDSWHLTKVLAEITTVSQESGSRDRLVTIQREAFHNNWITVSKPAAIIFGSGDDTEIVRNELINLSVSGKAALAGSNATAGGGNALNLEVYPGDTVTLTPNVTVNGKPDTTVVWDKSKYASCMTEGANGILTFRVPADSAGTTYTFDAYCKANKELWVTVALTVKGGNHSTSTINSGGVTPLTPSSPASSEKPGFSMSVLSGSGSEIKHLTFSIEDNNGIYVVEVPAGTTDTYEISAQPTSSSPVGTKVSNSDAGYVVFDSTNNRPGTTISRTLTCSSMNDDFSPFKVTVKFQVV